MSSDSEHKPADQARVPTERHDRQDQHVTRRESRKNRVERALDEKTRSHRSLDPNLPPATVMPPLPDHPRPKLGDRFGRFTLTEELGRGFSSTVFRAHHEMLRIDVALKILLDRQMDKKALDYVYREAHLLATLNHPNVIRILDFDQLNGYHLIVLEFIDGMSLGDMVRQDGRIPPIDLMDIIKQTVTALAYAHKRGVVHNDIKPANIMLTREGDVKVADLGMARVAQHSQTGAAAAGTPLGTPIGTPGSGGHPVVCGTPAYISPEMITGGLAAADHRSDIYSLGVSMYQCLTGRLPFTAEPGAGPYALLMQHVKSEPPDILESMPELEPGLGILIRCMMAKNPADRPQSYDELLADLSVLQEAMESAGSTASSVAIVFDPPTTTSSGRLPPQNPEQSRSWIKRWFGA